MAEAPEITFAIPFYSGLHYLEAAIRSVLSQANGSWRLVVCDDCGPDPGSEELVRSFQDGRITYSRNRENLGLAGNWNRCLELADTDFITLLHQDDELLPNYVDLMVDAAAGFPEAVAICCKAETIDASGKKAMTIPDLVKHRLSPAGSAPHVLSGEPGLISLLKGNFVVCPSLCYRRSPLDTRRFDPDWGHVMDLALTTEMLLSGQSLVYLPVMGYRYRRHVDSASTKNTRSLLRFRELFRLYERRAGEAGEHGWKQACLVAERSRIVRLNLLYCTFWWMLTLRWSNACKALRLLLGRSKTVNARVGSKRQ